MPHYLADLLNLMTLVTVQANFIEEQETKPAKPTGNPFSDVDSGAWYYDAVQYVHRQGVMNGDGSGRFRPDEMLSRAMLAQILYNREGRPAFTPSVTFTDVAADAWYSDAVLWAAQQGIVNGYGSGRFGPEDPITREQMATILWRYTGSPAATNSQLHFSDTDEAGAYAVEALTWAVENNIINGKGGGILDPRGQATRSEAAAMLMRYMDDSI